MARTANMSPASRVLRIVGGNFSSDALGPAYSRTIEAVRAAPGPHLAAFEQLFLREPLSNERLGELDPATFLAIVMPIIPQEARRAAAAVAERFSAAARDRESAFYEASEADEATEIRFQRQLIDDRRFELGELLRPQG
jgi:hypothetical protein